MSSHCLFYFITFLCFFLFYLVHTLSPSLLDVPLIKFSSSSLLRGPRFFAGFVAQFYWSFFTYTVGFFFGGFVSCPLSRETVGIFCDFVHTQTLVSFKWEFLIFIFIFIFLWFCFHTIVPLQILCDFVSIVDFFITQFFCEFVFVFRCDFVLNKIVVFNDLLLFTGKKIAIDHIINQFYLITL